MSCCLGAQRIECFDLSLSHLFRFVVVNVFFDPDMYNVTEGGVALITVRADREFTVPFSVIVTLQDGSAVGECNGYTIRMYLDIPTSSPL